MVDIRRIRSYVEPMTTSIDARLEIASWDETPYRELESMKFTRTDVQLAGGDGDDISEASMQGLMFYRPDGTSSYVSILHVTATLQGRAGSFVLSGGGTYDGTTALTEAEVVPDSGTGDLQGITGSARSESTQADYPYMPLTVTYDLP